jgi:hypothetical protein
LNTKLILFINGNLEAGEYFGMITLTLLTSITLISIFLLSLLLFILTHLRPLTFEEIRTLGKKRRKKKMKEYFNFKNNECSVDMNFKKRMKPTGKFYPTNELLYEFPSVAAGLLKYKKHEWSIIAFEKERKVFLIWVNKGTNKSSVSTLISTDRIADIANRENTTSVLTFHNHPNSNPNYVSCTNPSQQDIKSAEYAATIYNKNNLNLLSFVCERGRHYRYYFSPSDSFLPLSTFIEAINEVNGKSRSQNLSLHFERLF